MFAFAEDEGPATRLAGALGAPLGRVQLHRFPDGEALTSVAQPSAHTILYRSLARPDDKLMPLLLAADGLRRAGAGQVTLVAPYMPYLRQDKVFAPGQPLSRDVLGRLLGEAFDRIVTVEPHLHRTPDLGSVFMGRRVDVVSVADLFAREIGREGAPIIVGPDAESEPWTAALAGAIGTDHLVFQKKRSGDRQVELRLAAESSVSGRRTVLADDICSSGGTLIAAVRELRARGAASIEIFVAHALFSPATEAALRAVGAVRIVSTDSCPHATNRIQLADTLARVLIQAEAGRAAGPASEEP